MSAWGISISAIAIADFETNVRRCQDVTGMCLQPIGLLPWLQSGAATEMHICSRGRNGGSPSITSLVPRVSSLVIVRLSY